MSKKSMEDRFMDAAVSASEAGQTLADQRLSGSYSLTGRDGRRSLADIKPRPSDSTRDLDPNHILDLAESIAAIGLLQPIAIDKRNNLVAGEHRLEACRLLELSDVDDRHNHWNKILSSTDKKIKTSSIRKVSKIVSDLDNESFIKRYSDHQIPVVVLQLDASKDFEGALAAETAENEKRKNYSKKEIDKIAERLKIAGFIERSGRPKKGEKSLKKALAVISGKSYRQIERDRSTKKSPTHDGLFDERKELMEIAKLINKFISKSSRDHALIKPFEDILNQIKSNTIIKS